MELLRCVITFIILSAFQRVSAAALSVSAVLGQTAKLPCSCLENKNGVGMEFTKLGLPEGRYVIFVRDGRPDETWQISEYSGRVDWTSDWTLLIQDVIHNDEGTYHCNGFHKVPGSEDPQEVQCSVTLTVRGGNTRNPDQKSSQPVGENMLSRLSWEIITPILIIIFFILCIGISFCLKKFKKKWCKKKKPLEDVEASDDGESRIRFI